MKYITALCAILCAATGAYAQEIELKSGLETQTYVAVTAYNNGLALVRERRVLEVPQGRLRLQFMDVAERIRPETVSLQSLSAPGSLRILEQNYEYDLINPAKLMEKFVGRTVKLVNSHESLGFDAIEAELLSVNGGAVYRVGDEIFLGHPGHVVLPEIPENLISEPTLVWLLENQETRQTIETSYLTQGIGWRADYVVRYDESDGKLDLDGWVTLTNESGATYTEALLKLVAGDVNIVPDAPSFAKHQRMLAQMEIADANMAVQEAFAEYHLYTIPRPTTIKENQSKQVALLSAAGVDVRKTYEFRGQLHYYYSQVPAMKGENVGVYLTFTNAEANRMGMPIPAGVMRVYQEDEEGMLQFAGEDRVRHTPKDEDITLRMGNAFDIIGDRVQTDFRVLGGTVYECEFEITLRNHKNGDIVVDVVEPMPGDWEVLHSSLPHRKKDAHTAIFSVPVEADGEATLRYRTRIRM
jgi:hypothetical protein